MIKQHFSALTNSVAGAAAAGVRRAGASRHPLRRSSPTRRRPRPRSQLSDLRPARNQGSVGGYRDIMLDQLFGGMLGARLDELSQGENPPFLRRGRGPRRCSRRRGRGTRRCSRRSSSNDGVARGLDALVTELQRVARFGFTATELDAREAGDDGRLRARRRRRARTANRRAAPTNTRATSSQDEALPTIWQELAFHRRFIPEITLAEMNALAARLVPRAEPARRRVRAGGAPASCCRPRRSSRPSVKSGVGEDARRRTSTPAPGRR